MNYLECLEGSRPQEIEIVEFKIPQGSKYRMGNIQPDLYGAGLYAVAAERLRQEEA